jgi:FKBP-type peptidyl-prolyl cis-trans isomerase 2
MAVTPDKKRIVSLEYELRVEGGDIIESSAQRGPLRFISGSGQLLPALEKRVDALKLDQEESGVLKAKDAFGNADFQPTRDLARKEFPASEKLEPGKMFAAKAPDGSELWLQIVAADDKTVKVRYLHPLHDKNIAYRVKVLAIEDAKRPPAMPASVLQLDEE